MAANPLRAAHRIARQDNRFLGWLFGRYIGGAKHPRGAILSAYRVARRELSRVLDSPPVALEVVDNLNNALLGATSAGLVAAIRHGAESAVAQVRAYTADGAIIDIAASVPDFTGYQSAIMGAFNAQRSILRTMITAGAASSLIIGDKSRLGVLKPGPVMFEAARWLATGMHDSFKASLIAPGWNKQAIPVFDEFTTECCLNVAGQIVPLDGKFHLTGTPRFADNMDWSPFHGHCRTSIALYRADYDDGLTQAIEEDARRTRNAQILTNALA